MVKKLKTLAKADDTQLASAVRASAQQIWQAGLGAFAKAQEEGGRVFTKLVKEGTDLQKRTRMMAEDKVTEVTSAVADKANGSWDKLEQVFEDRVARALTTIGVPTQKDVQALTKRVEQLSKAVAELSGKKVAAASKPAAAAKPAAAKKAAPAKAAAKKPAARKPAAKKAAK